MKTVATPSTPPVSWVKQIRWDSKGLVPVIAQEVGSNDVLMFAWMNREALQKTVELGHVQTVHEIRMDCDSDVILLKVTQLGHEPGIACHTGRHSCFFSVLENGVWKSVDPVLKDPDTIYK
jgi:phosphoribosyl-AMP cyclohydrolase